MRSLRTSTRGILQPGGVSRVLRGPESPLRLRGPYPAGSEEHLESPSALLPFESDPPLRSLIQRSCLVLATGLTTTLLPTTTVATEDIDRIRDAMNEAPMKERIFNEHITVLSSPWMEGRLPGTRGMEYAREYVSY